MSEHEFDAAQADADDMPAQDADENMAGCCGPCDPCAAYTFKQNCSTRNITTQSIQSRIRQSWRRYQFTKCGPKEYNIYNSWLADSALRIDARTAILADGLAPQEPPNAARSAKRGCCLLEAKWSQTRRGHAMYIDMQTFVRTAGQKHWVMRRYNNMRRGILYRLNPLARRLTPQIVAGMIWDENRRNSRHQARIYNQFCNDPSTPYTNFLYICGELRFCADYHRSNIASGFGKGRVIHSPLRQNDWKTTGKPRGC